MTDTEVYNDLFPALVKLHRIQEVIDNYNHKISEGFYSRSEQNVIGAEYTDKIREILS